MHDPILQSHTPRSHWWIVFFTGVLTVITGTIGYAKFSLENPPGTPLSAWLLLDAFYLAIQLLVLHTPDFPMTINGWMEAGRWLGVATFLVTTWFLVFNRLQQEIRLLRMSFWRGHYVICSLGVRAMALIESIKEKDPAARIVAIDPEPAAEFAERCHGLQVCVIRGQATGARELKLARVTQAREILAVGPDDEANIRAAAEVRMVRGAPGAAATAAAPPVPAFCRVHIANSHLPEALQKWTDAGADRRTLLRFFDIFDAEARRMLGAPRLSPRRLREAPVPLDGAGVGPADARSVHVVILGMGRMGSALILRAAKMGHFANAKPLRITAIDRDAPRQKDELFFRYPILARPNEVCDLQVHQWHADSLELRQFIERCAGEKDTVLHVFVSLDSNARAVEIGLRLWEIVARHPEGYVHVRITSRTSMAPILQASGSPGGGEGGGGGGKIDVFGMLEDMCTVEAVLGEQNEALARSIHEDFVASHRTDGAGAGSTPPGAATGGDALPGGDPALAEWDHLREDFRESNRQQADHMGVKMRAIGCRIVEATAPGEAVTAFTASEVEMLAEVEHRRWNAERWLSGWRYGTVTDKAQRIHHCLVPWKDLSEEIRNHDRETVRKLPKWLAGVRPALKVVRQTGPRNP